MREFVRLMFFRAVTISSLMVLAGPCRAQDEPPLSVCTIVASLNSFRDRVVKVLGEFEAGPEQFILLGESCKQPFVTEGYTWPSILQVRFAGGPETPRELPFRPDPQSIGAFQEAIARARRESGEVRACILVTGMIQMRSDYTVRTLSNGRTTARGFGHMSAFPAQLIIKSVEVKSVIAHRSDRDCACCK